MLSMTGVRQSLTQPDKSLLMSAVYDVAGAPGVIHPPVPALQQCVVPGTVRTHRELLLSVDADRHGFTLGIPFLSRRPLPYEL